MKRKDVDTERRGLAVEASRLPSATDPQPVPSGADSDDPRLFFNRELSWLNFNWRVLRQALDSEAALLDRVRFLAITADNLDEFFRKRVGGLKRQAAAGVRTLSPDGRMPQEQIELIQSGVRPMHQELARMWDKVLRPALSNDADIHVRNYDELTAGQRDYVDSQVFDKRIFPILTPLAVDPGHPFPFISNLSLSLAVLLRRPEHGTEHFARIKVPTGRGRFVQLTGESVYTPVEQVVAGNSHKLFRGMEVMAVHPFRITRNADITRDEDEADDLLEMISEELRERRFAPVVRLEVGARMPEHFRELLMEELSLNGDDVYEADAIIGLTDCAFFADLDRDDLKRPPWTPVVPARLRHNGDSSDRPSMFNIIRAGDVLLHHPYESFRESVQRFVEEAAADPAVIAIKQTLYRTSENSPVVKALIRAAERGKQVAVLVEVKARFDEQNNIDWGQMMEKAGVHVTYGLVGLKTHAKVTLVLREEGDDVRAYCHIGTGNYNPATALSYTDLGLLTCRPDIGADIINLFHYLTGYAPEQHYRKLVVAPRNMREAFVELLQSEAARQQKHGNGRVVAKMNSLDDIEIITELYLASQAGVKIDLIVRGHCRLRPGLEGFSDNIRVRSILGRFLEHSRIYAFHNGGDPRVFISSGDWQRRNLDDRVEATVEVEDHALRDRLLYLLDLARSDTVTAWDLRPDGVYAQPTAQNGHLQGFQEQLMAEAPHQNQPSHAQNPS